MESVKNIDVIIKEKVEVAKNTYFQVLISRDEGPNFAMRRFIIEQGGKIPEHTNSVEHEQFVLKGHARLGIGGKSFEIRKNNIVFIPAGIPHWYETKGDEAFEFLCMVPNKEDKMEILGD